MWHRLLQMIHNVLSLEIYFIVSPIKGLQAQAHDSPVCAETMGVSQTYPINLFGDFW